MSYDGKDTDYPITPRQVAKKTSKETLRQAIRMSLDLESPAVRHNTQTFNAGRYRAVAEIADYDALKDRARAIKEDAIERLPELLQSLERVVKARGGFFHLAKTGKDASEYITRICRNHEAKLVVKAKSMTSEEAKLNHYLEDAGIEVAETDLAEFILQVADEQPSHIVGPAIHRSRERISELFKRKFKTDYPLDTGEQLTKFARDLLRDKFLSADVGISGANVIAAETGTIVLVESEGNIRMVTQAPPVHIALAGVEKVVPSREDLVTFIELLGPSATGQPLTSYTSMINPPISVPSFAFGDKHKKPREFHLVLLDNGRMKMRDDPELRQTLYCIRCGACLNSCANFQAVGGHAFGGETYSGGIGGSWEAGTAGLANARFSELCTGCSRCRPQCPVRIDIPWLNEVLRQRMSQTNEPGTFSFIYKGLFPTQAEDENAGFQKQFFAHFDIIARLGSRFAPWSNWLANLPSARFLAEKFAGIDRRRSLPAFHKETLTSQRSSLTGTSNSEKMVRGKVAIFADMYTNYNRPQAGAATAKVLQAFDVDVTISEVVAEGRAALSQGMLSTAHKQARDAAQHCESFVEKGRDLVVIEPSVLALFRHDYSHLLEDPAQFAKLRDRAFEPVELLVRVIHEQRLAPKAFFKVTDKTKVFFHSHCQQRTSNAAQQTIWLLEQIGFEVLTSTVECCGMAGSFGYKKDFYELSMRVGEDLLGQIKSAQAAHGELTLLASGISCYEQISALTKQPVLHPMELLASLLIP